MIYTAKKFILFLLAFFLVSAPAIAQQSRKKVGVVLSGGGAKGTAHVRALKVIEEAGIPIDIIVGTSMGSLVGGLYAIGYSTNQLDSIIQAQDWGNLLTDAKSRSSKSLNDKLSEERCLLSFNFEKSPVEVFEGGLLKGNSVGKLLSDLTIGYHDSLDFRKLPIPFACAAVDIVTGEEVDMYSGVLPVCMRSSMAIPGVFAPIHLNGKVMVDGGLANNYPVDLAKKLGADLIIGVTVGDDKREAEKLKSVSDVLLQVLDIVCENKVEENQKQTDVLIKVDISGYSSASFSSEAIDSLMHRGEKAAREKWEGLIQLKEQIGLSAPVIERQNRVVYADSIVTPPAEIYNTTVGQNKMYFGARYDTEEMASLLLGGTYQLNKKNNMLGGLELRLGKQTYGEVSLSFDPFKRWNLSASYRFSSNETKVYNEGKSSGLLDYNEQYGLMEFSRSWREVYISLGTEYVYRHHHNFLANSKWVDIAKNIENEYGLSYFVYMHFDNQDSKVFPHKGFKWTLNYSYFTDNGLKYKGGEGMHILEGFWQVALPASKTLTIIPQVAGRIIPEKNEEVFMLNAIGGVNSFGHYERHQMPFAGANYMEYVSNKLLIGGLTARQKMGKNQYLFGVANYAMLGKSISELFNSSNLFGMAVGYGINTAIGPIEAHLNWSTLTDKLTGYINIGFAF